MSTNLTKIEYVYSVAEKNASYWFTMKDTQDAIVLEHRTGTSIEDMKAQLDNFFEYNEGVYKIELRNTPDPMGRRTKYLTYNIKNFASDKKQTTITGQGFSQPINNDDKPTGREFFQIAQSREDKIRELLEQNHLLRLEHLQEKNRLENELFRMKFLQENKNEDSKMTEMIMGVLPAFFGSSNQVAVSGVGDAPVTNENDRISNAINRLIKVDKNFVTNLEKLANLAEKNKTVYDMAINQLNSFA